MRPEDGESSLHSTSLSPLSPSLSLSLWTATAAWGHECSWGEPGERGLCIYSYDNNSKITKTCVLWSIGGPFQLLLQLFFFFFKGAAVWFSESETQNRKSAFMHYVEHYTVYHYLRTKHTC